MRAGVRLCRGIVCLAAALLLAAGLSVRGETVPGNLV